MAYPPTPDHVWDITTPADTQPANQGGADFRNLKDDVMQRMALLSGTLANRPSPETVNATWGGSGFGLTYLSTDTNQFFQWNGSSWVDITSSFSGALVDFGTPVTAPANTSNNAVYTATLLGGLLGTGGGIEIVFGLSIGTITGSMNIGVQVGSFLFTIATLTVSGSYRFRAYFMNKGVANANSLSTEYIGTGNVASPSGEIGTTIDTTTNQTINVNIQKTVGSDVARFYSAFIRRL